MHKKYINQIVKKLRCSGEKRKEIRKQLTSEFIAKIEGGEDESEIIKTMGTPDEIAEEFNNSFSQEEQKKYRQQKWIKRLIMIVSIIIILITGIYSALPKVSPIEESNIFQKEIVEAHTKEIIELWNKEDLETLKAGSIKEMQEFFQEETIESTKEMLHADWGEFQAFGNVYIVQIHNITGHSALAEITVSYENINVTYTLFFNKDMKLEGLWMR